MTKRIFWSTLVAQIILLIVSTILTVRASFVISESSQRVQLKEVAGIISYAYEQSGDVFIADFDPKGYNITLINKSGKIINDNAEDSWYLVTDADALVEFLGKVVDSSDIVESQARILTGELLCAGRCFDDGTILVVTTIMQTLGDTLLEMKVHLISIVILSILLSLILANAITIGIMKPLNNIDLESPNGNRTKYKEIQPFFNKIYDQKMDIAQSTEKLEQRESQFTAITGAIQEGLILVGRHNRVIFINPSAIKILNIKKDPLYKDYTFLGNEELCSIIHETIQKGAQSTKIELEPFTYQVESTPMTYDKKKNGVAILIYDITRRVTEENRRRDFTANVSHELKTPLHVISGCSELLNSGLVKPEDQKTFITQIHDQATRMTQLVTDIIELSRLEAGSESTEMEDIDLAATAKSCTDNLLAIAMERNIELKAELSEAWIRSSYTIIYEMIYNLVDNALKYTEKGGHVSVITRTEGKNAIVIVKDDGIGIAKEHLDRIFERFYRVDKSRSREVGGTGLGLAIVKHAAITSGGKVTIESLPGEGSTFTATFPKCEEK